MFLKAVKDFTDLTIMKTGYHHSHLRPERVFCLLWSVCDSACHFPLPSDQHDIRNGTARSN